MHYMPRGGGGEGRVLKTIGFRIICYKSSFITFHRSLGMRNQVEIQKERSQKTLMQQNSMHSLPGGVSEINRFQNSLLQIQFNHVL